MKLSIVLSTQPASFSALAYKGELETNLAKIANLGYDGVELAVRDPKLLDAGHVSRMVEQNGLEVPAIGTGQAYGEEGLSFTHSDATIREHEIERIKSQVDLAVAYSAIVILGLIRGKVETGVQRDQALDWLVKALRECANYASRKNIK